jgi:ATP-dependent helicase YprA (DUF1998 family)
MSTTEDVGTPQLNRHYSAESEKSNAQSENQSSLNPEVLNWLSGKSRSFIDASPDGQLSDKTRELQVKAENIFGFKLKQWQINAIDKIQCGKDVVIVAGTGSGKSIVFQGACLLGEQAIVLVICPLVSLMEDQVSGIT